VPRSAVPELPPLVKLVHEDRRYKLEAYQFVGAGLEYAQETLGMGKPLAKPRRKKKGEEPKRPIHHVTGQELCLALKHLAHDQYGYMAKAVLGQWGIRSTSDFGEIVYNLIRIGKMSQSEGDRREDFNNVYEFEQALVKDYSIAKPQ
jgi:uncharacterized repeat protein (TIGR04138 family)